MKHPQAPVDEAARLADLRALDVLDTPAEERFDRITRLAKALFDVPIALVSLVDDKRQWFKSRQGLVAGETSRDISFCGHAILENQVLWVEDASQDDRFHDNPLVTGDPNIRFYGGYPLRNKQGHALGTLCVIDSEPRPYSPRAMERLTDLGQLVTRELESLQLGSLSLDPSKGSPEDRKQWVDEVTGVWNREGMSEVLRLGLESCAKRKVEASVLLAVIDQNSNLEDTWSSQGSDIILAEVAQVLRSTVHGYDSIGRTGDAQFCLFFAGSSFTNARERVEALQAKFDENPILQSIGVRMQFGHKSVKPGDAERETNAMLKVMTERLDQTCKNRIAENAA